MAEAVFSLALICMKLVFNWNDVVNYHGSHHPVSSSWSEFHIWCYLVNSYEFYC